MRMSPRHQTLSYRNFVDSIHHPNAKLTRSLSTLFHMNRAHGTSIENDLTSTVDFPRLLKWIEPMVSAATA